MKRILSGVQATGNLHLGNYLGAIKPWARLQSEGQAFYFIPDLHTLNVRPKPEDLRDTTLSTVAWLLAAGIDPERSIIFKQSLVPAHSELAIILENYVNMGELSRMTQYKDKSSKRGADGQVAGLFTYPTLMAADILLYDTNTVPVGEDQKQHVELARDIAERFNNLYGQIFVVPEPEIGKLGARVMNLQNPSTKMSKSDADQSGNVMLLDTSEQIIRKFKRAVTDSGSTIAATSDKPAMANLLQIYAAVSDIDIAEIESRYAGKGYGEFKQDLGMLVASKLEPLRLRHESLIRDQAHLKSVLQKGSEKAAEIADQKLNKVQRAVGLR